jgi:hypothetical protein
MIIINGCSNTTPTLLAPDVPGSISGQVLWLRADQVVSPVNGSKFSTWNDLSPLQAVYSQTTSANQLSYNAADSNFGGKPTITSIASANMTSSLTNSPLAQPFTLYACFLSTSSTYQIMLSGFNDSGEFGLQSQNCYGYSPATQFTTPAVTSNTPHIMCIMFDGNSSTAYLDNPYFAGNPSTGSGPSSVFDTKLQVGYVNNADGLLGQFAELMCYTGLHTDAQRASIFAYLNNRYNLGFTIPFTPKQLKPSIWLRSDLGISTTAGLVNQWADQSGNSHNVSQANALKQPTYNTGGVNGLPKITFTPLINMYLENNSFTQATANSEVFAVFTATSTAANAAYVLDQGVDNNVIFIAATNNNVTFYNGGSLATSAATVNQTVIANGINLGSGNGSIAVNGGTPVTGNIVNTAQVSTFFIVGNSGELTVLNSMPGDIYEIISFNYVLNTSERADMISYLKARYGIS